ncbi:hypothetical protein M9H77_23474 [Catharanthus roseus]|uniref:Uncharacterized protein n=1 Tax=Catharanthus roseus TaxID=4058 RepID=A0ACC0ATU6_CATRO|nr:hypothetical protein M9H77_23474 [Catharanthus roseus]
MEGNHIFELEGELMLNDGSGEEEYEGSDNAEELQEPRVSKVVEQYNHKLHLSMSRFMLAHRSLISNMRRKLEMHDTTGLRHNKSVRILEVQVGGLNILGCLPRDCRNYVQKVRMLNIGAGDAYCLNRMFIRMHQKNSDFFHLICVDDKVAYEEFNNVVCIYSTYLVNKYKMCTWLTGLGSQALAAIMKDQCKSMENEIKEVMPTIIRQYYIWHIMCKLSD